MKSYHDITSAGVSAIPEQVAAHAGRLAARMASVRHVVAVVSGKGGVGKSTVTVNLAAALAVDGDAVGILDADLNGPTIARMTGVRRQQLRSGATGIVPAVGALGIRVMSMDLFLPDDATPVWWEAPTQRDAYAWRGLMEANALREFMADTEWGKLDFLLVDLPPGTDRLPNVADLWPKTSGAVVVTIPSAAAHLVVEKSITMAKEHLGLPVIGLVENMATYVCPHCGQTEHLFPSARAEAMAAERGVAFLGGIPFDPRLAAAADDGTPFTQAWPGTPAADAFRRLAAQLRAFVGDTQPDWETRI